MKPNWAEENLQTIRTLMERSALYRRALAPVMIVCGIVGLAAGVVGWEWQFDSSRDFVLVWSAAALFGLICSILLVRQQALKDSEPFWSPPLRRVTQALMPPFGVGALVAVVVIKGDLFGVSFMLVMLWCWLYGCALWSAGFFVPRGLKVFGLLFVIAGCLLAISPLCLSDKWDDAIGRCPHIVMAAIFGGLHLAYGIYLYFTEKKNPAA